MLKKLKRRTKLLKRLAEKTKMKAMINNKSPFTKTVSNLLKVMIVSKTLSEIKIAV